MSSSGDLLAAALQAGSRSELLLALPSPRPELTLGEILRLSARLRELDEPRTPLRLGVLRTYAVELLRPHWTLEALLAGFELDLYEGPYGALLQEAEPGSGLLEHDPELLVVFARPEDFSPELAQSWSLRSSEKRAELVAAARDRVEALLRALRERLSGLIVFTLLPRMGALELGHYDAQADESQGRLREELERELAALFRNAMHGVLLHDLGTALEEVGRRRFFDRRLWHSSRFPFSAAGAQELVRALFGYAVRRARGGIKCIAVDADNTLWGGVVGEEGPSGLALGPDYPGSLYVEFQRRLLDFHRRGVLLALCSANNEADVLEVLRGHPHQVLREEHFAARRVNWSPKPANLIEIAAELNLGLDAVLFVDDSPQECHSVRTLLPAVAVVLAPADPLKLPQCLDQEPRLELLALTEEDRERSAMYQSERERRELKASASNLDEYLRSLEMVMTVGFNDEQHIARIAQLTQKTNQFNLTTRRYGEAEIARLMRGGNGWVASFSLRDVFGDSGIVGVAIVRSLESRVAEIDSFLMSCRVIGRRAEAAFLQSVLAALTSGGFERVQATYAPTPKNALVADFWTSCRFEPIGPRRYELRLPVSPEVQEPPIRVEIAPPLPGPDGSR
jgi:FkbH-like protein